MFTFWKKLCLQLWQLRKSERTIFCGTYYIKALTCSSGGLASPTVRLCSSIINGDFADKTKHLERRSDSDRAPRYINASCNLGFQYLCPGWSRKFVYYLQNNNTVYAGPSNENFLCHFQEGGCKKNSKKVQKKFQKKLSRKKNSEKFKKKISQKKVSKKVSKKI